MGLSKTQLSTELNPHPNRKYTNNSSKEAFREEVSSSNIREASNTNHPQAVTPTRHPLETEQTIRRADTRVTAEEVDMAVTTVTNGHMVSLDKQRRVERLFREGTSKAL